MTTTYEATEVISTDKHDVTGDLDEVMESLKPKIAAFLVVHPLTRWINVGFSDNGETVSNIAISQ